MCTHKQRLWLSAQVLSPHVPDLASLQLLLQVERTGSLGAAGSALGMSQQAASARLRAMERQVGVVLVTRGARGSQLTREGLLVARWAGAVVAAAARLDAGLDSLRTDRGAHLSVAASLTVAEHLVPAWLVTLRGRGVAPVEVRLETTNSEAVAELVRSGEVDLGFVEGPQAPRGLRSKTVGGDRLVLVVAPQHPWARRRRPLSPAELASTPLVSREAGSGTRSALQRALTTALGPEGGLADPALTVASAAAVRASVVAGVAPGALSSLAVSDDLALGRLVEVAVHGLDLERELRVVWSGPPTPPAGPARDLVAIATRDGTR